MPRGEPPWVSGNAETGREPPLRERRHHRVGVPPVDRPVPHRHDPPLPHREPARAPHQRQHGSQLHLPLVEPVPLHHPKGPLLPFEEVEGDERSLAVAGQHVHGLGRDRIHVEPLLEPPGEVVHELQRLVARLEIGLRRDQVAEDPSDRRRVARIPALLSLVGGGPVHRALPREPKDSGSQAPRPSGQLSRFRLESYRRGRPPPGPAAPAPRLRPPGARPRASCRRPGASRPRTR